MPRHVGECLAQSSATKDLSADGQTTWRSPLNCSTSLCDSLLPCHSAQWSAHGRAARQLMKGKGHTICVASVF